MFASVISFPIPVNRLKRVLHHVSTDRRPLRLTIIGRRAEMDAGEYAGVGYFRKRLRETAEHAHDSHHRRRI